MYEVHALKYAERDTPAFVWLITGGPRPVLVDVGFREDDAAQRHIRNYVPPSVMVERAGVTPSEIPLVTGHDPEVAERFKTVEPGIIRLA